MTLNIKDPEALHLAHAISKATGETMTRVVTEALRERYQRLQKNKGKASVQELLSIAQRASSKVQRPYLDHADFLYDDGGVSK